MNNALTNAEYTSDDLDIKTDYTSENDPTAISLKQLRDEFDEIISEISSKSKHEARQAKLVKLWNFYSKNIETYESINLTELAFMRGQTLAQAMSELPQGMTGVFAKLTHMQNTLGIFTGVGYKDATDKINFATHPLTSTKRYRKYIPLSGLYRLARFKPDHKIFETVEDMITLAETEGATITFNAVETLIENRQDRFRRASRSIKPVGPVSLLDQLAADSTGLVSAKGNILRQVTRSDIAAVLKALISHTKNGDEKITALLREVANDPAIRKVLLSA